MASGNSPEKLGRSGVAGGHCILVRTESLRAPIGTTQGRPAHDQWAKLRLIRDTISHYSPVLIAPLSNPISSRRRPEKKERIAGEGFFRCQPEPTALCQSLGRRYIKVTRSLRLTRPHCAPCCLATPWPRVADASPLFGRFAAFRPVLSVVTKPYHRLGPKATFTLKHGARTRDRRLLCPERTALGGSRSR
jgi:hypothetical protein